MSLIVQGVSDKVVVQASGWNCGWTGLHTSAAPPPQLCLCYGARGWAQKLARGLRTKFMRETLKGLERPNCE